jgi:hypothetical protein
MGGAGVSGWRPADRGGRNSVDSVNKIDSAGNVLDYFTPHDQLFMAQNDVDLGSSGPLLLPDQPGLHPHLMLNSGKNGSIYVVDRDNMGHYNPSDDSQIVQALPHVFAGNFTGPTYFNGSVFISSSGASIAAFQLANGLLSTGTTSQSSEAFPFPGGTTAISANGTSDAILWALQRNGASSPAVLRAYDASNLGIELYRSDASGSRDRLDAAAKFSVPLVANGRVFVTSTGRLTVFGLLP